MATLKSYRVGSIPQPRLPETAEQASQWQDRNRSWWQAHPMRYDWKTPLGIKDFSREFYDEIDRRFFQDAEEYLPSRMRPFDRLIPFEQLPELDVLEIGVGSGSHAGLMAPSARTFTGIDLTEFAVKSTSERLRQAGSNSQVLCMDAEKMEFPDESFDFIWSWGVIHHSADTRRVLSEMRRVLRPGGRAVIMVYHRSFWGYYVLSGLIHGLVRNVVPHPVPAQGDAIDHRWGPGTVLYLFGVEIHRFRLFHGPKAGNSGQQESPAATSRGSFENYRSQLGSRPLVPGVCEPPADGLFSGFPSAEA